MKITKLQRVLTVQVVLIYFILLLPSFALSQSIPGSEVAGSWNITVQTEEGERPAWLQIKTSGTSTLVGKYVGMEGSARPISNIEYSESSGSYSFAIPPQWIPTETDMHFEFTLNNDQLSGTTSYDDLTIEWTAVRAPDLKRKGEPEWGEPINLIDQNLSHWITADNNQFVMENGVLNNKKTGSHLITKEKFDDFKISLEFNIPEGSNSGVYLRGRYEVQIMDAYGTEPSSTSIGGVYGFIKPTVNASKPSGEWQKMEITLVGRMVTVVLNDTEVICNRPVPGITGGALDGNEGEPGPILIQGDHGPVKFRNIVITPARKM